MATDDPRGGQDGSRPTQETKKGIIKFYNAGQGYGFIAADDGRDYHFNIRAVKGQYIPGAGDEVTFVPKPGRRGPSTQSLELRTRASRKEAQAREALRRDDRIECPHCGRKIVPRMVTHRGKPDATYCPYCGGLVEDFDAGCLGPFLAIVGAVVGFACLGCKAIQALVA